MQNLLERLNRPFVPKLRTDFVQIGHWSRNQRAANPKSCVHPPIVLTVNLDSVLDHSRFCTNRCDQSLIILRQLVEPSFEFIQQRPRADEVDVPQVEGRQSDEDRYRSNDLHTHADRLVVASHEWIVHRCASHLSCPYARLLASEA